MATGDKKRAVMTTDINNAGSDYPVMPLKTIDSTPDATHTGNLISSAAVAEGLATKVPVVGKGINLLGNAYFVGGGSQQGGGQFPINQRGQTVYSGAVYGIDRWITSQWNTTATLTVQSGCILLSGTASGSNSCLLQQLLENAAAFAGKTVTASVLVGAVTANGAKLWIGTNTSSRYAASPVLVSNGLFSVTTTLPSDISDLRVTIGQHASDSGSGNTSIEIIAVKLELGITQTIAHQENGAWVLNDPPPDYGTELLKCQTSTADSSDTYANRTLVTQQDAPLVVANGSLDTNSVYLVWLEDKAINQSTNPVIVKPNTNLRWSYMAYNSSNNMYIVWGGFSFSNGTLTVNPNAYRIVVGGTAVQTATIPEIAFITKVI